MNCLSIGLLAAVSFWNHNSVSSAQQDMSDVQIKTTQVSGPIHMMEGRGGNLGVSVGEDGVLLIDDQYAPLADKIRAAIEKIGKGKLKFLLNTHYHGDHTGGNAHFGPKTNIIAHTNVRKRLSTEQTIRGRVIAPKPKEALPVITFDESLAIHFNGERIRAVHFPHSHTDGDTVVFFEKSNVVHMGDLFFAGKFPFVDLGGGGSVAGLIESVGKIIDCMPQGAKIIPGHGPLSTIDDLKAYRAMLVETTQIVKKRIAGGKSLDEVKKAGLPEKWNDWATGFINTDFWLETIYKSLSDKDS